MKIKLNHDALYRLMREQKIETVSQLSRDTGISGGLLYRAINRGVISKETYWKLADFFGCHIEDLQTAEKS